MGLDEKPKRKLLGGAAVWSVFLLKKSKDWLNSVPLLSSHWTIWKLDGVVI